MKALFDHVKILGTVARTVVEVATESADTTGYTCVAPEACEALGLAATTHKATINAIRDLLMDARIKCQTTPIRFTYLLGVAGVPFLRESARFRVSKGGLEPPRSYERQPLKLVRLPISPLRRGFASYIDALSAPTKAPITLKIFFS